MEGAGKATESSRSRSAAAGFRNHPHRARHGADRGILVKVDQVVEPLAVAKILKAIVERRSPAWSFWAAGDRRRLQPDRPDAGGLARLAARHLRVEAGRRRRQLLVTRESMAACSGQAQVTRHRHDRSALTSRATPAAEHHEGQEEPIDEKSPADYGVDVAPRLEVVKTSEPPAAGAPRSARSPSSSPN